MRVLPRPSLVVGLVASLAALACAPEPARVVIHVVDAATGEPIAARLELTDAEGTAYVADDAIPVTLECVLSPLPAWLAPLQTDRAIFNPYTGTTQFYVDGAGHLSLPAGSYRLRAAKGLEWRRAEQSLEVDGSGEEQVTIALERWADPARDGWYGADDHLHITRMHPDENRRIARWLRGEGLHVANLLEMGTATQISVTPQYAYGDRGAYRDGLLLLLTGEEHPRTHFLGHTITLGTGRRVDRRERYIDYEATFAEGRRLGGVSGFAHHGIGAARDGLAINAPTGLVRFVEVLQFQFPYYDVWYELLNLGVRIAPSAGTDFPCGPPTLPGRERFYAQIEGPVERRSFVEAVRAGRTFVTNGPLVELSVGGVGPGGELRLEASGTVAVRGQVRFDPAQDRIDRVELIVNGQVAHSVSQASTPGLIDLAFELPVQRSAWVALRSWGVKPADDGPLPRMPPEWLLDAGRQVASGAGGREMFDFYATMTERQSAAHSAAIWIHVEGQGVRTPEALTAAWLARLAELEARLEDDRIAEIPILDWIPYSDGVSESHLRRNRPALLEAIARARAYYARRSDAAGD